MKLLPFGSTKECKACGGTKLYYRYQHEKLGYCLAGEWLGGSPEYVAVTCEGCGYESPEQLKTGTEPTTK